MVYCLIKFGAKWCGPCRKIAADYYALISQSVYADIKFNEVDVDDSPDVSEEYSVTSLPTFILLKDSVEIGRVAGANLPGVRELLDSACE